MIPHLIASINEAREIVMDPSNAKNKDVTQLREACTSLAKDLESPADRLLNQAFQVRSLPVPTTSLCDETALISSLTKTDTRLDYCQIGHPIRSF